MPKTIAKPSHRNKISKKVLKETLHQILKNHNRFVTQESANRLYTLIENSVTDIGYFYSNSQQYNVSDVDKFKNQLTKLYDHLCITNHDLSILYNTVYDLVQESPSNAGTLRLNDMIEVLLNSMK